MLISKKITEAINQQIGNELNAFLQYIAIGSHFDVEALPELSRHFYKQADEEREHALRFIKFVNHAGGRVSIPAVPAPKASFKSPEEAVKLSLERELEVTRQINKLVEMAKAESDYTTDTFLQWFITEQLEEVASMDQLLKIVQRAGDNVLRVEEYLVREGGRLTKAAAAPTT